MPKLGTKKPPIGGTALDNFISGGYFFLPWINRPQMPMITMQSCSTSDVLTGQPSFCEIGEQKSTPSGELTATVRQRRKIILSCLQNSTVLDKTQQKMNTLNLVITQRQAPLQMTGEVPVSFVPCVFCRRLVYCSLHLATGRGCKCGISI